ncbi:hypothetical protein LINGRAHAP2_LOCUS28670 [Linum grandiflorum]
MEEHGVGSKTDDRISSLPDDIIIHQIIGISESPFKQSAQLSILSKRWNHIYHSCPTLIFDGSGLEYKKPQDLAAATEACKRFFRRRSKNSIPTESVTIINTTFLSNPLLKGFLPEILDLTAKISPRKVKINLCPFRNWYVSSGACQAIKTPNRQGFGISIKELYLRSVSFPEDGILDAMVSAASHLEKLSLDSIYLIKKFRVKDHPSLKSIAAKSIVIEEFEIAGVNSLETLRIFQMRIGCFRISSTPNLKHLDIEGGDVGNLENGNLLKLVSEYRSLESIAYEDGKSTALSTKFKIVNTNQIRKVELKWHNIAVVELDASELDGDFVTCFVTALAQNYNSSNDMVKLGPMLAELTEFRVNYLWFTAPNSNRMLSDQILFTRDVEHVKFLPYSIEDDFLDNMLHAYHPKFISFIGIEDRISNILYLSALRSISKKLVERASCTRCGGSGESCWNTQLQDVKLVINGNIRQDNIVGFGEDQFFWHQISFMLIWH